MFIVNILFCNMHTLYRFKPDTPTDAVIDRNRRDFYIS
jgi:hypothetical protein